MIAKSVIAFEPTMSTIGVSKAGVSSRRTTRAKTTVAKVGRKETRDAPFSKGFISKVDGIKSTPTSSKKRQPSFILSLQKIRDKR